MGLIYVGPKQLMFFTGWLLSTDGRAARAPIVASKLSGTGVLETPGGKKLGATLRAHNPSMPLMVERHPSSVVMSTPSIVSANNDFSIKVEIEVTNGNQQTSVLHGPLHVLVFFGISLFVTYILRLFACIQRRVSHHPHSSVPNQRRNGQHVV